MLYNILNMLNNILLVNYKDIIITLLVIIVILILYITFFTKYICNNLDYYIYDSQKAGPTVMIIGGTHGNEPAGSETIKDLIRDINLKKIILNRGKLILIPEVNYCGLKLNIRYIFGIGDLNRKYPKSLNEKISSPINNKIIELAKQSDFILDFHEGWGFHRKNKDSIGSTITPNNTQESINLATEFLETINKTIIEDDKKFTILTTNEDLLKLDKYGYSSSTEIKGSLRYYLNLLNKNYILIETTGQDNIQKIDLRKQQANMFINLLLTKYIL